MTRHFTKSINQFPIVSHFGRVNTSIGVLILCWCTIAWLGTNYFFDNLANELYQRELNASTEQAAQIAKGIDDGIEMLKGVSLVYSHEEHIQQALHRFGEHIAPSKLSLDERRKIWSQDTFLGELNKELNTETRQLGIDLIFIINAAGDCIAASNAETPGSAVGANYADRTYFPLAQAGKPGHQYAVGRTTHVPGLYYVTPVFYSQRFVGAVVVKREVEKFSSWTTPSNAFIADTNGVIVLASDKSMEFRALPDAKIFQLSAKERQSQYVREIFEPLQISPWKQDQFSSVFTINGNQSPVLMSSKPLLNDGISIYVQRTLGEVERLHTGKYWGFFLLAAVGSLLIVAASAIVSYLSELKRKRTITDTFGKYVDPRIVKVLIEDHQLPLKNEKCIMTVYFCDMENFTGIAEKLNAEDVVKLLNRYFSLMSEPIRESNGIIGKYIGDAILAFWGAPFTSATEHPRLACLAALKQIELLRQFETHLPDQPRLNMRIGISTGEVIVGNIGSEFSQNHTVIGDSVNLASRLESINKYYGTSILINDEAWQMVKHDVECREIDHIRVVGKTRPIRIFELMGTIGSLSDTAIALRNHFEAGLTAYRARQWNEARIEFEKCITLDPNEAVAAVFLSRIKSFRANPPDSDWDGIWNFMRK